MRFGRLNIYAGAAGLLVAAIGGLALGITFDRFAVQDGNHVLSLVRFYLREGHSHGMPVSLYNLIVGLLVDRWLASDRQKRWCSIAAVVGLVMPASLAAKGAAGAPPDFVPIGIVGAAALLLSFALLLFGRKAGGPDLDR